jgi:sRNA-binding carbon storage regulator CsrA
MGINNLDYDNRCKPSVLPIVNVIVLEIKGEYVKVGAESYRQMTTTWLLYDDLIQCNITSHLTSTRNKPRAR